MKYIANSFTTIGKGAFSGIKACFQRVITSPVEWDDFWQQHKSNVDSPPPIPEVDFTQNQVVAVFAGEKPKGNFSVEIISVEVTDKQIDITVKYDQPVLNAVVPPVDTQPYHIIKIPQKRSD